jgi:hypothetical protein
MYIGKKPTPAPLTSSDIAADIINNTHIGDTAISGFDALATAPADTDEFLISDAGVLKRLDASLIGGGGKVLQVVTDISTTEESSTSSSFADTALSLSITPSATTSKILVFSDINSMRKLSGDTKIDLKLLRDSTQIAFGRYANTDSTATLSQSSSSFHVLDTPSTTSALTYKIQLANNSAAGTVYIMSSNSTGTLTAIEIGA